MIGETTLQGCVPETIKMVLKTVNISNFATWNTFINLPDHWCNRLLRMRIEKLIVKLLKIRPMLKYVVTLTQNQLYA